MSKRAISGPPARQIRLQKKLGQHHLREGRLCRPLLRYLRPGGRLVVEVGPGGGVLTRELLAAGARVLALEIDPEWGFTLRRDPDCRAARVAVTDALDLNWSRLPVGTLVTGNLPFNISTALIDRLLENGQQLSRLAFLVQKEVADRLLAGPGQSAYGALSILTAARAEVSFLGRVGRGSFRPPPKVEASFIGLQPRSPVIPVWEMAEFRATVRLGFARRRKLLRNSLATEWGRGEADRVVSEAGLDRRSRAEELSLGQFLTLHRLHRGDPSAAGDGVG